MLQKLEGHRRVTNDDHLFTQPLLLNWNSLHSKVIIVGSWAPPNNSRLRVHVGFKSRISEGGLLFHSI